MHNGRMAAEDTATAPESCKVCEDEVAQQCACFADQEALGRLLADDPDPHVRIIAHMSNRQLALSESLGDLTKLIFKTAGAVSTMQEKSGNVFGELRRVTTTLESLVTSIDKMNITLGSLATKQSALEARTEALEAASV